MSIILVGFTYNCPDFMDAHSNTKCIKDHGYPPVGGIIYFGLEKYEIANVSSIQECPLLCAEKLKDKYTKDRNESPGCCEWRSNNKCYWSLDNVEEIYIGYDSEGPGYPPDGTRALLCNAGIIFLVQFYLMIQKFISKILHETIVYFFSSGVRCNDREIANECNFCPGKEEPAIGCQGDCEYDDSTKLCYRKGIVVQYS